MEVYLPAPVQSRPNSNRDSGFGIGIGLGINLATPHHAATRGLGMGMAGGDSRRLRNLILIYDLSVPANRFRSAHPSVEASAEPDRFAGQLETHLWMRIWVRVFGNQVTQLCLFRARHENLGGLASFRMPEI